MLKFNSVYNRKNMNNGEKNKIFEARPILKKIMDEFGEMPIIEYTKKCLDNIDNDNKSSELIDVVGEITLERLGKEVSNDIKKQLNNFYWVSTADHHCFFNSNLSCSSNILINEALRNSKNDSYKYNIVFSCAGITLSNEDYPRGIVFNSKENDSYTEIKLSIMPSNSHNSTVYGFRSYKVEEIEKINSVFKKEISNKLSEEQNKTIHSLVNNILRDQDTLTSKNFCEQITKINFNFWPQIFNSDLPQKPILYIEQEEVVNRLIIKYHLNINTLIGKIIFTNEMDALVDKLTTSMEKFLRQGNLPTNLFWYLSAEKNQRKKLFKKGAKLSTENDDYQINIDPASFKIALEKKELMPNLFLIYTVLHLYYNLSCAGGFNQIHYLKSMQDEYIKFQNNPKHPKGSNDIYTYGINLMGFSANKNLHGLDIKLYPEQNIEKIKHNIYTKKFKDLFEENAEIIYKILYETV